MLMAEQARARLLELFRDRALSLGRFTLASGKESTYYINSKKVLFNGEAIWLVGEILWQLTKDLNIQAIGGLEVGAIPMATAAALHYQMHGRSLEGFFVRKQAKDHGSQQRPPARLPRRRHRRRFHPGHFRTASNRGGPALGGGSRRRQLHRRPSGRSAGAFGSALYLFADLHDP